MTTRNPNVLMDGAAQPAAGLGRSNVIQHYGGPLRIPFTGNFAGASVEVRFTTKFPASGDKAGYANVTNHPDANFLLLDTAVTGPKVLDLGDVAPCALIANVISPASGTRIRAVIG